MVLYLTSVFIFAFSTLFTPGPNNIMLLNSGWNFGYKSTIPHIIGILFGALSLRLATAAGLGVVFIALPILKDILAIAGSLYLIFLAYKTYFAHIGNAQSRKKPLLLRQGYLFQFINPKSWMMSIGIVTIYAHNDYFSYIWSIAIISAMFFIIGIVSLSTWTMLGVWGAKITITKPKIIKLVNKIMAGLLVLSVVLIWI